MRHLHWTVAAFNWQCRYPCIGGRGCWRIVLRQVRAQIVAERSACPQFPTQPNSEGETQGSRTSCRSSVRFGRSRAIVERVPPEWPWPHSQILQNDTRRVSRDASQPSPTRSCFPLPHSLVLRHHSSTAKAPSKRDSTDADMQSPSSHTQRTLVSIAPLLPSVPEDDVATATLTLSQADMERNRSQKPNTPVPGTQKPPTGIGTS